MVKPGDILVCLLIVSLDATAAILGIQADVSQYYQVKNMRMWGLGCREPSQVAFRLGLAATILMGLAHVLTHLVGGCMCVCSQDELQTASPHRKLSMGCLFFSWIILAVGFSMLVIGTMWNNKSTTPPCGYSHHHFLSIGGVMCFLHALVCVAYYASAIDAAREEAK